MNLNEELNIPILKGRRARILVFEDEPSQAHQIAQDIKDFGCNVEYRSDPFEAIRISTSFRPDVLVFDIRIDKQYDEPIDGIIATGIVRRHVPYASTIFLTAFSDNKSYIDRAKKFNPIVLPKPYKKDELKNSISTKLIESYDSRINSFKRFEEIAQNRGYNVEELLHTLSVIDSKANEKIDFIRNFKNLYFAEETEESESELLQIIDRLVDINSKHPNFIDTINDIFGRELPDLAIALKSKELKGYISAAKYEADAEYISNLVEELISYE